MKLLHIDDVSTTCQVGLATFKLKTVHYISHMITHTQDTVG